MFRLFARRASARSCCVVNPRMRRRTELRSSRTSLLIPSAFRIDMLDHDLEAMALPNAVESAVDFSRALVHPITGLRRQVLIDHDLASLQRPDPLPLGNRRQLREAGTVTQTLKRCGDPASDRGRRRTPPHVRATRHRRGRGHGVPRVEQLMRMGQSWTGSSTGRVGVDVEAFVVDRGNGSTSATRSPRSLVRSQRSATVPGRRGRCRSLGLRPWGRSPGHSRLRRQRWWPCSVPGGVPERRNVRDPVP